MPDNSVALRLDRVEGDLQRETDKREQSLKYTQRLVEDIQLRYSETTAAFGRIEAAFTQHLRDDKVFGDNILKLDDRLRTVERLIWIAVGGIVVIGALLSILGAHMTAIFQ